MADNGGQEKTEQPTAKRRGDARKKGNVLNSKEVSTIIVLFGSLLFLKMMLPMIYKEVREFMVKFIESAANPSSDMLSAQLFFQTAVSVMKATLPLLLATVVLSILGTGTQTRFLVTFEPVKPNFGKLNPISGIRKLFSLKNIVELIKNLIKVTILVAVLYSSVKDKLIYLAKTVDMALIPSVQLVFQIIYDMFRSVILAFVIIAFFDFLYQRWDYEKNLKMTKQEVKDEFKQTEGNPEIKGKIRSIQRSMAAKRMIQTVPQADVIIRNPTHYAVALKYEPKKYSAPIVLAKGHDELALRIVRVGEEHNVLTIENKPLARALYASTEVGQEIPGEFYGAVAEILVYVYRMKKRDDILNQSGRDT